VPGYVTDRVRLRALAEPLEGPTCCEWSQVAEREGGNVAGGFCERDGDLDQVHAAHERGKRINPLTDRRTDVYSLRYGGELL
jgi:hypothetical protein